MKLIPCVSALFFVLFATQANAEVYYRHVPFTLSLKPTDHLVVDYDFSSKKAIDCTATNPQVIINFVYKGNQKSALLPVTLESDHVPNNHEEALADVNGQFNVNVQNNQTPAAFDVHCDYLADN